MSITREKKKEEAIIQFKEDDIVMVSEAPMGGLYWLSDEEKEMVKQFEQENNALVYIVVRAFTNLGKMDSLLYISDYEEEWEMENEDINEGYVFSYTINHDMPDCSEFGSIGVKPMFGGLLRIW